MQLPVLTIGMRCVQINWRNNSWKAGRMVGHLVEMIGKQLVRQNLLCNMQLGEKSGLLSAELCG